MNLKEAAILLNSTFSLQENLVKKGATVLFFGNVYFFWKCIIDYNFKLKVIMKLHWKVFESAPIGGNNFDFFIGKLIITNVQIMSPIVYFKSV